MYSSQISLRHQDDGVSQRGIGSAKAMTPVSFAQKLTTSSHQAAPKKLSHKAWSANATDRVAGIVKQRLMTRSLAPIWHNMSTVTVHKTKLFIVLCSHFVDIADL